MLAEQMITCFLMFLSGMLVSHYGPRNDKDSVGFTVGCFIAVAWPVYLYWVTSNLTNQCM